MRGVDPSSYTVFLGLIVLVVAAGSILVYRLRRDVEEDSGPVTDADVLRDLERAYYSGEMDQAEFRRVTDALKAKRPGSSRPMPPSPVPAASEPEPPAEPEVPSQPEPSHEPGAGEGPA